MYLQTQYAAYGYAAHACEAHVDGADGENEECDNDYNCSSSFHRSMNHSLRPLSNTACDDLADLLGLLPRPPQSERLGLRQGPQGALRIRPYSPPLASLPRGFHAEQQELDGWPAAAARRAAAARPALQHSSSASSNRWEPQRPVGTNWRMVNGDADGT